jgi:hypothetical protein
LNPALRDKWGQPTVTFDCGWKENEYAMRKDMKASAVEMLEAAGLKDVTPYDDVVNSAPGNCIHEMGTARMGRDPKTSKPALLDGGEAQMNIKSNGVTVITSEPVKTTFTPPSVFRAPGAAKPAAPAPKPPAAEEGKAVAPTGMRIAGFAIQAVKDGKVIAENVQDQSIKALIGSEGSKPGPLFSIDRPEKAEN